jgi:hypothetical protein
MAASTPLRSGASFKRRRADLTERGVSTPLIVERLDIVEQLLLRDPVALEVLIGILVLVNMLSTFRSSPPSPASAPQGRPVIVDARKQATSQLAGTTDWNDAAAIGRLCDQSDLSKVTPDVKSRCAAAHLAVTRVLLKAGNATGARRAFNLASNEGASPAALASTGKSLKTAEDAELKKTREADAAAKSAIRLAYAKTLREHHLDLNMDIKVTVTGTAKDRITLQFALFDDVWTHKVEKGDIVDEMRRLGFTRVDMTDGYDYHVYWDLK